MSRNLQHIITDKARVTTQIITACKGYRLAKDVIGEE